MFKLFASALLALVLAGCAVVSDGGEGAPPLTVPQRAYQLYGQFTVALAAAGDVAANPATPPAVVKTIYEVKEIARPAADELLAAARAYADLEAQLDDLDAAGLPKSDKLLFQAEAALQALTATLERTAPKINRLIDLTT